MTDVQFFMLCYFFGNVPFGYFLSKYFLNVNVREKGSGNIGAINVARLNKKLGVLTFALDAMKAFVPLFLVDTFSIVNIDYLAWGGFWVIMGHMFPVLMNFKGGKGVSTLAGAMLALSPFGFLIFAGVWFAVFKGWRYASLASVAASLSTLVYVGLMPTDTRDPFMLWVLIIIAIFAKHFPNFKRIFKGDEPKLG